MNSISVDFQDCPWTNDGNRDVYFRPIDLRHAAIGAGRNWRRRGRNAAEKAHILARISDILSTIDLQSGTIARVTGHYRSVGTSRRGIKSFEMGNAFCALIAYKELKISWLVDIEALTHHYKIKSFGPKRADFIGRSSVGKWYAFEAKGRSTGRPGKGALASWEIQVDSVKSINTKKPQAKIVSATYANLDDSIHAIWRDPSDNQGEDINVPDDIFFRRYYEPILRLIDSSNHLEKDGEEKLANFSELEMAIGVHSEVREALSEKNYKAIDDFAQRLSNTNTTQVSEKMGALESGDVKRELFPDGIIIRM